VTHDQDLMEEVGIAFELSGVVRRFTGAAA
jgi:hypothetical protein